MNRVLEFNIDKTIPIHSPRLKYVLRSYIAKLMVFNATFNNISVISWSVLLVEKTGVSKDWWHFICTFMYIRLICTRTPVEEIKSGIKFVTRAKIYIVVLPYETVECGWSYMVVGFISTHETHLWWNKYLSPQIFRSWFVWGVLDTT